MALPAQTWQSAARQKGVGGVQPPADPGEMGNIAYAPGMMKFGQNSMPLARQMTGAGLDDPGSVSTGGPPAQSPAPSTPGLPALPPEYAQRAMQLIMDAIRRRSRKY